MRKTLIFILATIQALVGLSALPSGVLLMLFPDGSKLKMSLSMLDHSPFSSFFFPGLILFLIIGAGHCVGGHFTFNGLRWLAPGGAVCDISLMIWIFVQVSMVGGGHWLQYLYFSLGTAEVAVAFLLQMRPEKARETEG